MQFHRFEDLCNNGQAKGKRVFIRADLNVPLNDAGEITEDTRIRASVPCIQMALKAGAAVMVTSHLGRPTEGEFKPEDSLAPVAARMSELLGREDEVKALIEAYKARVVCVVNSFRAKLLDKKMLFAMLHDERIARQYTADEAAAVKRHVPWTRKVAEGKTKREAIRSLKRQISNTVYRQLVLDAQRAGR